MKKNRIKIIFFISLMLFLSNNVNSQILYHDLEPNIHLESRLTQTKSIYLNFSPLGINDSIRFSITDQTMPGYWYTISAELNEHFYFSDTINYSEYVKNLNFRSSIQQNIDFTKEDSLILICNSSWDNGYIENKTGFLGFAYTYSQDTIYGWIRIKIINFETPSINTELFINDFAISTNPDYDILAGEGISPIVEDIVVKDIANNKNETDMNISFSKAILHDSIQSYRVFIVPEEDYESFNLDIAETISEGNYFDITSTDVDFNGTIPENTKDINGNNIVELSLYRIFVLSIPISTYTSDKRLSNPSCSITLYTPLEEITINTSSSYYQGGSDYELYLNFDSPNSNEGVDEYRLILVNCSDTINFNKEIAENITNQNYEVINTNDDYFYGTFNLNQLLDFKGDEINRTDSYVCYVLMIPDMSYFNGTSLIKSNQSFVFYRKCNSVEYVSGYDYANNNDASDLSVELKSTESDIFSILKYRIFIVEDEIADDFTNEIANQIVDNKCYFDINPTNYDLSFTLPSTLRTSSGNLITTNSPYRLFVQSIANNIRTDVNALSEKSRLVSINDPNSFHTGQEEGLDITYYDIIPDSILSNLEYEDNSYSFSFNDNPDTELKIELIREGGWHGDNLYINLVPSENVFICLMDDESNSPDKLPENYSLNHLNSWRNDTINMSYYYGGWWPTGHGGLWYDETSLIEQNNNYLGLMYIDAQDTSYIWINLAIQKAIYISVKSYAIYKPNSQNVKPENSISIYPNPCNNILNISLPKSSFSYNIQIYNTQGKLLLNKEISNLYQLDVSYLSKGMYIIKAMNEEIEKIFKFIVQ